MREKILRTQEAAADFIDCDIKTIWRMVRTRKLHPRQDGGFNKSELEPIKEAYYLKYRRHFAKEYGFVCKTLKELSAKTKIDIVTLLIMKKKGFTSFQKNGYYYTKEAEIVYNQFQTQEKKSASDGTAAQIIETSTGQAGIMNSPGLVSALENKITAQPAAVSP